MQTQNPSRRNLIFAVSFGLLCVIVMLLAYRAFNADTPLHPAGYRFSVLVPDAGALVPGSDVQEAGVKVGRVVGVKRVGGRGEVTVELENKYAPIGSGARVIVRAKSLLGEAYMEVAPGPPDAPPLRESTRLPAGQVDRNISVNEFLDAFGPRSRSQMRQLFGGLAEAFGGQADALNASLANAAPTSENFGSVLAELRGQTSDLQGLVESSAVALGALGRRQHDLQASVTAADSLLGAMARRDEALQQTVREFPSFLAALQDTSETVSSTSKPLDDAAGVLLSVSPKIPDAIDALDRKVPKFDEVFRELPHTVSAAKAGLPALTRIVRAVPTALDQLYPTLRELIPITQLFADYRGPAVVGPFSNAGSSFNGTYVGPRGKIFHRVNGVLYVSNETPVGWTKRLPSSRANPYPKPDGFEELAKQGFLNSYDCRHTRNPPLLPPIGTGVPPCKEQGAWNYRGKKAYYPRLYRADP